MGKEMMGFESEKRLVRDYSNRREEKYGYKFKSQLERKWADYLELLKAQGHITSWEYEPDTFYFKDVKTAPVQYTPDFKVVDGNEVFYQETKGYHDGQTNTKFRRMAQQHPETTMELVLQRIPKRNKSKGAGRRRIAAKYVRRIIDASEIFKQAGL